MNHELRPDVQFSDKAIRDLKEALYKDIGLAADTYTLDDLQKLGNFLLHVTALHLEIKLREKRQELL